MNSPPSRLFHFSHLSAVVHLRQAVQERILQGLKHYLEIPHLVNQINKTAIELHQLEVQNMAALRQHFFQQMKLFPSLSGIQVGTEQADYLGILDLGNRTPTVEIKRGQLGSHKYAYALDAEGQQTETCLGFSQDYDPRKRPWYIEGCNADPDRPAWSPVYQYSSSVSVQLGVMATQPFFDSNGHRLGVLGCDLALTHISQMLAALQDNMLGTCCILERSGDLIASSSHLTPFTVRDGKAIRLPAQACPFLDKNQILADIVQQWGGWQHIHTPRQLEYPSNGQLYLVDICPLAPDLGLDWLVITCIAASDLLPDLLTAAPDPVADSLASLQQINQYLRAEVQEQAEALRASRQALKRSEERWQLALEGANDGLWDWNLETNEVFFSERWQEISGYRSGELAHHFEEWKQRIHPDDLSGVMAAIQAHLHGETNYYVIEHRTRCKDGSYKWVLDRGKAFWNQAGQPVRMVGSRSDTTTRKLMESRLIFQAEHDAMTGLSNRSALVNYLQQLLELSQPSLTVIFIDIDRFKAVNDSLGHTVGDQLIINFAQGLKTIMRVNDIVARLSGDEFVILMQSVMDAVAIQKLVERIKIALQQVVVHLNIGTPLSLSIGITTSDQSHGTPHDFLRDADIAMYAAKYAGGNRHVFFEPALREQSCKHLKLESDLKRGIEQHELIAYYQPIVCLKTLRPTGFEALIRWQHPHRGMVSPAEFIPLAEKTGLIIPIGQWILEQASQQLQQWQVQYAALEPMTLHVNVSVKQFYQPDFIQQIDYLLEHLQLQPESLWLEITESCFIEKAEVALETMNALKRRRVRLCIDDFGTGYSSLSYLHNLPVDTLKIDRSFVSRMVNTDQGIAMIRAILAMSQSFGIQVVAEGIETSDQLAKLQELGCDFGQGFLFARPGDARTMEDWLHEAVVGTIMVGS
jgi:diguanylate cyclase (GGDEF)-like protein/PAS domain S-box-containing protein